MDPSEYPAALADLHGRRSLNHAVVDRIVASILAVEIRIHVQSGANVELASDLVRVLARITPNIVLVAPPEIREILEPIRNALAPVTGQGDTHLDVEVGDDTLPAAVRVVAREWGVAVASPNQARPTLQAGPPVRPVAMVAACLTAFRVMHEILPADFGAAPASQLLDLWDYGADTPAKAPYTSLEAVLVGLGSIGSTAAWLLALSVGQGKMTLIDPDVLKQENLARYVYMMPGDVDSKKVAWCADQFQDGIDLVAFDGKVEAWVAGLRSEPIRLMLVSPDRRTARRAAADAMPERSISATVNGLEASVNLGRLPTGPCSYCANMPGGVRPTLQHELATWTGLPYTRVLQLVPGVDGAYVDQPLDHRDITSIEMRWGCDVGSLGHWIGKTLRDMHSSEGHRRYAALVPSGTAPAAEVTLPMPAASALAGALMALEAIKAVDTRPYNHISYDARSGRIQRGIRLPNQEGKCLCQHPERIEWFAALYGP